MEDIDWKYEVLELLQKIAKGYAFLSQYECARAIEIFSDLPKPQYYTGWVQSHIGKAYFEMVNYSMVKNPNVKSFLLFQY